MEDVLRRLIPQQYSTFAKLTNRGEAGPYRFDRWDKDETGAILRYWFWSKDRTRKHRKSVSVTEMQRALAQSIGSESFSRCIYEKACPKSFRSQPCGFAVMGRCLEFLGVAEYRGFSTGFHLTDKVKAIQLSGV
jgi:hypothetical protein